MSFREDRHRHKAAKGVAVGWDIGRVDGDQDAGDGLADEAEARVGRGCWVDGADALGSAWRHRGLFTARCRRDCVAARRRRSMSTQARSNLPRAALPQWLAWNQFGLGNHGSPNSRLGECSWLELGWP